MAVRVAINGFGRIGRTVMRVLCQRDSSVQVVAINDLSEGRVSCHLLKYDSIHGNRDIETRHYDGTLVVNGMEIHHVQERDPHKLPWADLDVDVVLEATGRFTDRDKAAVHIERGARRVLISAPGKGADITLCKGVNDDRYDPDQHFVVSNASCTTNCLGPVAKVLHESLEIQQGFMTTCHAYTQDQRLLDAAHKDLRRARAAALSVIPTTTGAARALGLILPELAGKVDGNALRVPVPVGSVVDLVCTVGRPTTVEEVNALLRAAAEGPLKGIMEYSEAPLVSMDIVGNHHSAIIDGLSTMVNGSMVKVLAWYDNEWGYSERLVDVLEMMG